MFLFCFVSLNTNRSITFCDFFCLNYLLVFCLQQIILQLLFFELEARLIQPQQNLKTKGQLRLLSLQKVLLKPFKLPTNEYP
jgi:hypothetical protein